MATYSSRTLQDQTFGYTTNTNAGFLHLGDNSTHEFLFTWYVSDATTSSTTFTWALRCISQEGGSSSASIEVGVQATNGESSWYTTDTPVALATEKVLARGTYTYNASETYGWRLFAVSITIEDDARRTYNASETFYTYFRDMDPAAAFPVTIIGDQVVMNILPSRDYYSYDVSYKFGDITGTIATRTTDTAITWTVPESLYAEIPNDIFLAGIIEVKAYSELSTTDEPFNTSSSYVFVRTSAPTCAPTLAPTIVDTNSTTIALTGNSEKLVAYYSNAKYAMNATANGGATITSLAASNSGTTYTEETGVFTNIIDNIFQFAVVDSRNYYTKVVYQPAFVSYIKLTNNTSISNPTSSGSVDVEVRGNVFTGSFGLVSNAVTVKYRYKVKGTSSYGSWNTITATTSGNQYSATATITGLNYQSTYVLQTQVADKLSVVTSEEIAMKAQPVYDWSAADMRINVPLAANNGMTVSGGLVVDNQNVGETFSELRSIVTTGTWTPAISCCESASSLSASYGNWIRTGNLVILNFYISGVADTATDRLFISSLPFYPETKYRWQSGGGNLLGAYCATNNTSFCGWNVEFDSELGIPGIYARCGTVRFGAPADSSGNYNNGNTAGGYMGAYYGYTFYASGTIMMEIAEDQSGW